MMYSYEGMRRVVYGDGDGGTFVPVCPICGRFVKADKTIRFNDMTGLMPGPTATCKRCGRVEMPFDGFI